MRNEAECSLLKLLPRTSLVAFSANRVANPAMAWRNSYGTREVNLESQAYCIRMANEHASAFAQDQRTFFAERYGGVGVVANGGGARCGVDDMVQIKGIGRNVLAGSDAEFWHSYGGETIAGGIRDALWGEIFHSALPYGSARVHGIISTGTEVPLFGANKTKMAFTLRGLTVREPVVRPAHYIRSLYFCRKDEQAAALVPDAVRTRHAIDSIALAFYTLGLAPTGILSAESVNAGLIEMFRRFALQSAAARAKKLVHGAITASNIALDGRWIDYGTASTVSDFGPVMVSKGPDANSHQPFAEIAHDLIYYLKKYAELGPGVIVEARELRASYEETFNARLRVEMLKLTGISELALERLPGDTARDLAEVMFDISRSGNREPFQLYRTGYDHCSAMPEKMGDFHLNSILARAVFADSASSLECELRDQLPPADIRYRFVERYWKVRGASLGSMAALDRPLACIFMALNSLRLNQVFPQLYRPALDIAIDKFVLSGSNIASFIDPLLRQAKTLLNDPVDDEIDLGAWSPSSLTLNETTGFWIDGHHGSLAKGIDAIDAPVFTQEQRMKLRQLCPDPC